jgi:hypothetical protein
MSPHLQNAAAIAACLGAAAFVLWRAWKTLRGRTSGCGTACSSCPSSAAGPGMPTVKPLMSIEAAAEASLPPRETHLAN